VVTGLEAKTLDVSHAKDALTGAITLLSEST